MLHYLRITLCLFGLCIHPFAAAQQSGDEAATEAQLESLRQEIAAIQRRIERQSLARDDLQQSLRDIEIRVAESDQQLSRIQADIRNSLEELRLLDGQASELEAQRNAMESRLVDELRNLWALQQGGGIKVLLGDQGPERTARNLAYYQELMATRTETIAEYEQLLVAIEANRAERRVAQQALSLRRDELARERDDAVQLQSQRQATLASIERSLSEDSDRVAKLEADSARLTALLEELRNSLAELETPASYKPFVEAKGEFEFPVNGRPSNRFGGKRNVGNLRWRGWLIPAREGSEVRAIHHGRVVYSDWLRGQGLLMILDHGDGWLSLYAHNRTLQAEVGDSVVPGEIIAQVGSSGGAAQPGLYFEIRKDGTPVDPTRWLGR